MIKRPSSKDSENDILQMQQEFLAESNRNASFQPAAKVVRLQRDVEENNPVTEEQAQRKSEFARRRNLKKTGQTNSKETIPQNTIIGEIVEKQYDHSTLTKNVVEAEVEGAFPKPVPLKIHAGVPARNKSLFAQMFNRKEEPLASVKKVKSQLQDSKSAILEGADATDIHEENLQKMQQMSEEEILKEKQHLHETMDPKLVEFLKARKKGNTSLTQTIQPEPISEVEELDVEVPNLDVFQHEGSDQWINFNILESEKLEWTKNIRISLRDCKPGESYESRFDWKGILQPFVDKRHDEGQDDRELYLHGEDADRPGYTLQELFRLARANVLQQRVAALNAIGGILNIFNQGFYDGVLELPISKIFFFIRFALDENTPVVVEAASRALAFLFYNDTDETLLDTIYDTKKGIYQPELGLNVTHSRQEEEEERRQCALERGFDSMKLSDQKSKQSTRKAQFQAQLDDDPDDLTNRESMNDYHLAETDLLECLLRTNILERIRYILFTMRPEGNISISCAKLLIRLARTNRSIAEKIATNEQLIQGLIGSYLGNSVDGSEPSKHEPQHLVIKLLRVICSYDSGFYGRYFSRLHVTSLLKRYVFTRSDINVKLVQVQTETFRFLRLILKYVRDDELFREILPALFYLLEWHFQHLTMEESGPYIIRQHAAALLALIGYDHLQAAAELTPQNCDRLFACFSKWFNAAIKHGAAEFSQKLLLAACLETASKVRPLAGSYYHNFTDGYLMPFLRSAKFDNLTKELSNTDLSNLDPTTERSERIPPLPNLGGILTSDKTPPTLVLTRCYPVFFLYALLDFLREHAAHHDPRPLERFVHSSSHFRYLSALADTVSVQSHRNTNDKCTTTNWFLKTELFYLLELLALLAESHQRHCGKPISPSVRSEEDMEDTEVLCDVGCCNPQLQLAVAFKVLLHLSEEYYPLIIKLFDEIVFSREFYSAGNVAPEEMQRWKFTYKVKLNSLLTSRVNPIGSGSCFNVSGWRKPLLSQTWPYSLLYLLLEKLEQGASQLKFFSEEQIIQTSLSFSDLVENNLIRLVSATEKLMYLMTAFLGPGSKFLDAQLSSLITLRIDALREEMLRTGMRFDFETRLEGKKSYHGLYQLMLDIFQSSSYGHAPFSALVMAPLAQIYDIQWRNVVWSEHVAVLRFITCTEQQLFGSIDDYRQPAETDVTLLRYYNQALNSNLLRPGSLPAQLAAYHVETYRAGKAAAAGTVKCHESNDK
ncbi:RNA polymerase II-associated protein 1 [Wyeomyia smithii]|uniref:RNA polymerase II-associated protein 1 n=1 Tax=Wyeomyia smithii TaxID=174621 RepID=UPI002467EAC5|nr:RNA polymerase II-associated protein 1 [Wyeomyia smithii]